MRGPLAGCRSATRPGPAATSSAPGAAALDERSHKAPAQYTPPGRSSPPHPAARPPLAAAGAGPRWRPRPGRASPPTAAHGRAGPTARAAWPNARPTDRRGRGSARGHRRPLRLDLGAGQRGERHGAGLPHRPRPGEVGDDAMQPRPKRGAALEALDAAQDPQPGLLHDLLGDSPVTHVDPREPQHARAIPIDQRPERSLVPPTQRPQQLHLTHAQDRTAKRSWRPLPNVGPCWIIDDLRRPAVATYRRRLRPVD